MPTKEGLWWLGTIFLLMLMGWGYANNLCLALAVLLLSLTVIFLIECHFNVDGFYLSSLSIEDQFAQHSASWMGAFTSRSSRRRHNLKLSWDGEKKITSSILIRSDFLVEGEFVFPKSKHWHSPIIVIESSYPMGLFRAWSYQKMSAEAWIYPEPKMDGISQTMKRSEESELESLKISNSGDELHESKVFEAGDNSNRIDWKYYARSQQLRVKTYLENETSVFYYSWPYQQGNEEAKSLLSGLFREHFKQQEKFGFKLPQKAFEADNNQHHYKLVMRALTEAS